mmetsp:Transcript_100985/g.320552  ORF Transcript_100985/g.320552 Transcript_100985/m.320552 type:complete len:390 (+) Transcript_100985:429-1598(+)
MTHRPSADPKSRNTLSVTAAARSPAKACSAMVSKSVGTPWCRTQPYVLSLPTSSFAYPRATKVPMSSRDMLYASSFSSSRKTSRYGWAAAAMPWTSTSFCARVSGEPVVPAGAASRAPWAAGSDGPCRRSSSRIRTGSRWPQVFHASDWSTEATSRARKKASALAQNRRCCELRRVSARKTRGGGRPSAAASSTAERRVARSPSCPLSSAVTSLATTKSNGLRSAGCRRGAPHSYSCTVQPSGVRSLAVTFLRASLTKSGMQSVATTIAPSLARAMAVRPVPLPSSRTEMPVRSGPRERSRKETSSKPAFQAYPPRHAPGSCRTFTSPTAEPGNATVRSGLMRSSASACSSAAAPVAAKGTIASEPAMGQRCTTKAGDTPAPSSRSEPA